MERRLEELTLNAWPALRTVLDDGWLLRFADGYTRRANSVNPLYPSADAVPVKVARCEAAYARRGLPTVFKLTAATEPPGLDAFLAERGYRREAESIVQLADLADPTPEPDPAVAVAEEWLEALVRSGDGSGRHAATIRAMLRAIEPPAGLAALRFEGEIAALALGVVDRGHVGLFDVVTAPPYRGRGFGTRVVTALLRWGRAHGARRAHLAVQADNAPALRLYAKLGFREAYRYWYRVKAAGS